MSASSHVREEYSFKGEVKFKQFTAAVEKALKNFEGLTEWHDLISALARINKVLLAYMQYPVVPLQLTVCKRLTQCLHPNLPSGVHLRTLDVYTAIFDRIGSHGLLLNLLVYSSGLFPLLSYASMSVRPPLLAIYEKYFLPLGAGLVPALHGLVLSLLPGLEDESEHSERICNLLNAVSKATDESNFFHALWQCVLSSPDYRLPAVTVLLGKLNKKLSAADQVHCLGGSLPLVVSGVCAALQDKNVLVQRTILDVINILFPFHASFLLPSDLTTIVAVALETLLKRDASLSRRFYSWVLGPSYSSASTSRPSAPAVPHSKADSSSNMTHSKQSVAVGNISDAQMSLPLSNDGSHNASSGYFLKHSKTFLLRAIHLVLDEAAAKLVERGHSDGSSAAFKAECVFPYRVLRALYDRPEVSGLVMKDVMLDLVWCLKIQLNCLGGAGRVGGARGNKADSRTQLVPGTGGTVGGPQQQKKSGSGKRGSVKAEIVQSANLLFASMSQDFVWQWMESLLENEAAILTDSAREGYSATATKGTAKQEKGRDRKKEEDETNVERLEDQGEEADIRNGSLSQVDSVGVVDGHQRDVRAMSPISEMLESQRTGRRTKNIKSSARQGQSRFLSDGTGGKNWSHTRRLSRKPGLAGTVAVVTLMMEVLPKDTLQGVHVCRLLVQLVSLLRSCQDSLSSSELADCLSLAISLLRDIFLRTPASSTGPTPGSTPTSTPVSTPTAALSSVNALSTTPPTGRRSSNRDSASTESRSTSKNSPTQSLALGLSLEELKLKMYEDYMAYFSGFISRYIDRNSSLYVGGGLQGRELCLMFASSCQFLVLLGRSLAASQIAVHTLEEEPLLRSCDGRQSTSQLQDWLSCLVQVCGRGIQDSRKRESIYGAHTEHRVHVTAPSRGGVRGDIHVTGTSHMDIGQDVDSGGGWEEEVWLVAMETLLNLTEMASQSQLRPPPPLLAPVPLPSPYQLSLPSLLQESSFCLLPLEVAQQVIFTPSFVQELTSCLWGFLSVERPSLHPRAAPVLGWLRSLVTWNKACEAYILNQFSTQTLDAHQRFTVLWHYLPDTYHRTKIVPFYRVILRMVEGLQSTNAAVLSVTRSWVKTALSNRTRNDSLIKLLQPALKILLKPNSQRKPINEKFAVKVTLSQEDAKKDMKYAQYYFKSLGIENPYAPSKKIQYMELLLCYRQLVDASQLLYALSLVESVVAVDPKMFVLVAGNVMVDLSVVTDRGGLDSASGSSQRVVRERSSSLDKPQDGSSSKEGVRSHSPGHSPHKSLLELLLSICVDLLRSQYHPTLKVSTGDQLEGLNVKVASSSLLSTLLKEILKVLVEKKESSREGSGLAMPGAETSGGSSSEWKVLNPSFVSALMALCDVQVVVLLLLGKSVQWWEEAFHSFPLDNCQKGLGGISWASVAAELSTDSSHPQSSQGHPLSVLLHSLNAQLLRTVQCLIVLDTQLSLSFGEEGHHGSHMQTHAPSSSRIDPTSITSGVELASGSFDSDVSRPTLLPEVLPGCLTASQPYFKDFLLLILRSPSLSSFHNNLLHMFSATICNLLHQQVLELAPNLVKQLCANIEHVAGQGLAPHLGIRSREQGSSKGHYCVVYLKSVLDVIRWSMFGMTGESNSTESKRHRQGYTLQSRLQNSLYNIVQVAQGVAPKEIFSPTLKQPSTMSWLFGVFSTSQKTSLPLLGGSNSMGGGGGAGDRGVAGDGGVTGDGMAQLLHGVDSLVGQHVLMLLPAIYNAMATVWTNLYLGDARKGMVERQVNWRGSHMDAAVTEDIVWLFGEILCSLAGMEPTAFFSSISHIWLEWNISNNRGGSYEGSGGCGSTLQESVGLRMKQESFIDILHQVKVLPLDVLLHCLQSTLADIARVEDHESSLLRQQYLLHFLYKYISSSRQSSKELLESRVSLVSFLKEYHGHIYNPTPQALVRGCSTICMLISILHVIVCRVAPPNSKTQKKERKELQDLCHKLCETLSNVANVGIAQPDYVMVDSSDIHSTSLGLTAGGAGGDVDRKDTADVKSTSSRDGLGSSHSGAVEEVQGANSGGSLPALVAGGRRSSGSGWAETVSGAGWKKGSLEESEGSGSDRAAPRQGRTRRKVPVSVELLQPALQALTVLSNVLAHFIDCIFDSSEKEKVTALLKAVLLNVWPHLHNHSQDFHESYTQSSKLLASLSGFQVTRKSWRKEAFDLFLAPDFFSTTMSSLLEWKVIVDNLMTQDQVTFRDLLTRIHSTSATGVVNIFSSLDQEISSGRILLKRMAFALLSGEIDQYVKFLPDIQEKLSEYLRVLRYPSICCEIFLTFRVLLLKFSPHYLLSFWPAMTAELISQLSQLEMDLMSADSETESASLSSSSVPHSRLQLYLAACKLLDTALALPPQCIPHFQWLKWGFVATESEEFIVARLCKLFQITENYIDELNLKASDFALPFLGSCTISSLQELRPFFAAMSVMHSSYSFNQYSVWKSSMSSIAAASVEEVIMQDFLEPFI